ncbi:Protein of unknown function [Gryllus bimaculatus]|nr:Protein of unknown function [Gryllus bimaculatus]
MNSEKLLNLYMYMNSIIAGNLSPLLVRKALRAVQIVIVDVQRDINATTCPMEREFLVEWREGLIELSRELTQALRRHAESEQRAGHQMLFVNLTYPRVVEYWKHMTAMIYWILSVKDIRRY